MTSLRILAPVGLLASCALALSGCALLGGGKPANLYRFGQSAVGEAALPSAQSVGVLRVPGPFQREAAGDRILTVTGGKAAYIAETRWVGPAATLFHQAVTAAFDADPGPVRLVSRGEAAPADYILRLEVRNFEARYDNGPKAPPTVVIRTRAVLTPQGSQEVREQMFDAEVPAGDNRVTAIVAAYDQATDQVLDKLVAWTNAQATPRPATPVR